MKKIFVIVAAAVLLLTGCTQTPAPNTAKDAKWILACTSLGGEPSRTIPAYDTGDRTCVFTYPNLPKESK